MNTRRPGLDPAARSRARRRAVQAIYAWQLSGTPMREVIQQFAHEQDMDVADSDYFEALARGVSSHHEALDAALAEFVDRPIAQIDPIERAILRLAAFELRHRADVPYRVVINEAIEAAKRFGAEHGHSYVNGVLDRAAASWRSAEVEAARGR